MSANGSKYALDVSITRDSFALTVDQKPVGPGPAHYGALDVAFRAAGAWLWIYAEASQRKRGPGHGHEWDTLLFRAGGKYGFLTPRPNGERHAAGPNAIVADHRKSDVLQGAMVVGYIHTHPAGPHAAFDTAGEILSPIDLEQGDVAGDLGVALSNPQWWIGVLTPQAKITRARLRTAVLQQFSPEQPFGSNVPVTEELKKIVRRNRDRLFEMQIDQQAQGGKWKPFAPDFREKCIAEATNDLA